MSTPGGGERRRLRDSLAGNLVVITVTAAIILAGVWVVNGPMRSEGKQPAATATASEPASGSSDVSPVTPSGKPVGAAPKVGQPAPDFTTISITGDVITLSELKGKPVWLVFGATWCSNCRAETPDVQAVQQEYGEKAKIVAVYVGENLSTVTDYAERLKLTYAQVADSYTDIGSLYRVMGLPTHVFIDAEGIVRSIKVGTVTEQAATSQLEELLGR